MQKSLSPPPCVFFQMNTEKVSEAVFRSPFGIPHLILDCLRLSLGSASSSTSMLMHTQGQQVTSLAVGSLPPMRHIQTEFQGSIFSLAQALAVLGML